MLKLLYQPYKWLFFGPFFAINTFVIASVITVVCLVSPRWASRVLARFWARSNLWMTPATVRLHGTENLKPGQSYVVVANHMSQYDIFALYGWLDLDLKWVMKKELRKVPALGAACAAMGHVFIDRSDTQAAVRSLQNARKTLTEGTSVLFFPEGTRSDDGRMGPFKKGAFVMAKDLELPILPVTIIGTDRILPNNSIDLMPGVVDLVIHPAISADEVRTASAPSLCAASQAIIASALAPEQVVQSV